MSEAENLYGEEHVRRYRETAGDVGHRWKRGSKILLLTTKGRKSGEPRTKPLIYEQDGDRYVIVASKGGAPEHPDWYENLQKDPNVDCRCSTRCSRRVRGQLRAKSANGFGSSSTSSGRTTTATRRRPTGRSRWSSLSAPPASARSGVASCRRGVLLVLRDVPVDVDASVVVRIGRLSDDFAGSGRSYARSQE